MKRKFLKALQFALFLLAGLALLYVAFRGIDIPSLMQQIRRANWWWVALAACFTLPSLLFRAFRWRLLIRPVNEPPRLRNIFHAINIGYLANFVFPRIGEITRCGVLNQTDRIPVSLLFGTVIIERIFDLLMAIIMLCLLLILRFNTVSSFIMQQILQPIINRMPGMAHGGLLIATVVLLLIAFFVFFRLFRTQLSKIKALRKIKDLFREVINGIRSVYRIRNFGIFIILNFLIFGMYYLQTWLMFYALQSTSILGAGDALFILVLSTLSFIVPVQGGIGAYHWIVSTGLTVFGLTRSDGMVYATISHSVTSTILILMGAVALIFVFWTKRKQQSA